MPKPNVHACERDKEQRTMTTESGDNEARKQKRKSLLASNDDAEWDMAEEIAESLYAKFYQTKRPARVHGGTRRVELPQHPNVRVAQKELDANPESDETTSPTSEIATSVHKRVASIPATNTESALSMDEVNRLKFECGIRRLVRSRQRSKVTRELITAKCFNGQAPVDPTEATPTDQDLHNSKRPVLPMEGALVQPVPCQTRLTTMVQERLHEAKRRSEVTRFLIQPPPKQPHETLAAPREDETDERRGELVRTVRGSPPPPWDGTRVVPVAAARVIRPPSAAHMAKAVERNMVTASEQAPSRPPHHSSTHSSSNQASVSVEPSVKPSVKPDAAVTAPRLGQLEFKFNLERLQKSQQRTKERWKAVTKQLQLEMAADST